MVISSNNMIISSYTIFNIGIAIQLNIIFTNWKDAINFIIEDFKTTKKNNKFGMWPAEFLNEIDQFRDGKAAFRMGNYLKSLIDGFNSGLKRDDVLSMAAEKYICLYGKDKILS